MAKNTKGINPKVPNTPAQPTKSKTSGVNPKAKAAPMKMGGKKGC